MVVQRPYPETSKERRQTICNHRPHSVQNLLIPVVLPFLLSDIVWGCSLSVLLLQVVSCSSSSGRPKIDFHDIHASEQNRSCEKGEGVLMERRILDVVIVYCNEGHEQD